MTQGEEKRDEHALGQALELFAGVAVESMLLAAHQGVCLDVHPSNFASSGQDFWYLDDDVGTGNRIPTIGYALLRRVEEYAHRPLAVERYVTALETQISSRISKEEAAQLDLEETLERSLVRSDEAKAARSRLSAAASRCLSNYVGPVR